jgi:thiopurine S-methyltransferase
MEHSFWHECWQNKQIGFHLPEPHLLLEKHWHELQAAKGTRVLVPLCGKSLDLNWLAGHGHEVIGAELSEIAVDAFFSEQDLDAEIEMVGAFKCYRHGNISIFCGDFFQLTTELTGPLDHFYDRAAVGALPEAMRKNYARQMKKLLPAGTTGLCISNDFNQGEMPGPPFSVPPQAMQELYGSTVTISKLETVDALEKMQVLKDRGLTRFQEHALLMKF